MESVLLMFELENLTCRKTKYEDGFALAWESTVYKTKKTIIIIILCVCKSCGVYESERQDTLR